MNVTMVRHVEDKDGRAGLRLTRDNAGEAMGNPETTTPDSHSNHRSNSDTEGGIGGRRSAEWCGSCQPQVPTGRGLEQRAT